MNSNLEIISCHASILEDFENASPYFCTFLANRIILYAIKSYLQVSMCNRELV